MKWTQINHIHVIRLSKQSRYFNYPMHLFKLNVFDSFCLVICQEIPIAHVLGVYIIYTVSLLCTLSYGNFSFRVIALFRCYTAKLCCDYALILYVHLFRNKMCVYN